jgi:hypothetical protein
MRRIKYWWHVMRAGRPGVWAAVGAILAVVGGDLLLTGEWGLKHRPWGLVLLPVTVLAVVAEGAYRESERVKREHKDDLAKLCAEHEADLAELRAGHQAELTRALAAHIVPKSDEVRVDPADWIARGEYTPRIR